MKLQTRQIEPFIKNPDPKARVILIYGPEAGLIKERSKTIAQTIVADIHDPFNAVILSSDSIFDDPASLSDEAHALSMMGGNRIVTVQDGSDKIAETVKEYLKNPSAENLVLIESGDLKPKSKLRSLCEKSEKAAALPCYVEEDYNIAGLIRQMLKDNRLMIEPPALNWLAGNLSGNRLRVRTEIEKLILYKGEGDSQITLDEAQACCGDAGSETLEQLIYSVAGGHTEKTLQSYQRLLSDGVALIAILRSLQNHFRRLHYTKSQVDTGLAVTEAMKALTPPVFFKQADTFKQQVIKWEAGAIEDVLHKLAKLESDCKKSGAPDTVLCGHALLALSYRAPK